MIQKRYEGFLKTACLWKNDTLLGLKQLDIVPLFTTIDIAIQEKLRLGKYVERLVVFELKQHTTISILAENIQIQKGKTTVGELDCLYIKNNRPVHLEIIYKFYLYDTSVGTQEIEHFIGPNRKDTLLEKLIKLKDKQLPLLHTADCKKYLDQLGLKSEDITQEVYFKAQLFVPYRNTAVHLKTLNPEAIVGLYINKEELNTLNDHKFYVPSKKDWLIAPHYDVNWMTFETFKPVAQAYLNRQFSPLCWMKAKNGTLVKMFLVWW
ncbi:DUF1853 family protein [Mariniflexile ostreae]|uniref:DUF1853 family protein n=1 Tax=Mariniflexile ostreae TaxID=1520892 RepID=A0ABV5FB55_9FLAO